jgi:hypothetical protein
MNKFKLGYIAYKINNIKDSTLITLILILSFILSHELIYKHIIEGEIFLTMLISLVSLVITTIVLSLILILIILCLQCPIKYKYNVNKYYIFETEKEIKKMKPKNEKEYKKFFKHFLKEDGILEELKSKKKTLKKEKIVAKKLKKKILRG